MSQIHCCLGEFCIHRKLLRVDFDSERICKWARSTWIELDRAFWSALLSAISERGGAGSGSCVPGWIFYTTCLMFLKAGCIFCATLLLFKKLLLQKWAHFSVYYYMDLPFERKSSEKNPQNLRLNLLCQNRFFASIISNAIFCINPFVHIFDNNIASFDIWVVFSQLCSFIVFPQSSQKYLSRQ